MNSAKHPEKNTLIRITQFYFPIFFCTTFVFFACQKIDSEYQTTQTKSELVTEPLEESTNIYDVQCNEVSDQIWELKQNQYGQWYASYKNVSYTVCWTVSPTPPGSAPPSSGGGTQYWQTNMSAFNSLDGASINNIHDYFKCLNPNSAATITVYVDQPTANTDHLWFNLGNNNASVGDVFIEIQQGAYTRIFGFYPLSPVDESTNAIKQGILLDKSNKPYDVALTFGVSSNQFSNILNFVQNSFAAFPNYNFFYFNNVDYAVNILLLGGLQIIKPTAYWPSIGTVSSAGLLGELLKVTQVNSAILSQSGVSNSFSTACP